MIPYSRHSIGIEEEQAVLEVLRSGCLTGGPKVEQFEADFAAYTGARNAVAVSSGAAALYLAVKAMFPGPGARIAVPALTYVATANAVLLAGHLPVFCDVDPSTFCIDPGKIPVDVDAVIPVHYAGHPADLDAIGTRLQGRPIIEDAAHAAGAEYRGRKIGASGISCFSFHPCKNMTTAEGGMICCESDELAVKLRRMRLNGITKDGIRQDMTEWGFKFNLNEIQAAIGIEQLKKLDRMNARRREIAAIYDREFEGIGKDPRWPLKFQEVKPGVLHSRHMYVLTTPWRDTLIQHLNRRGIGTAIHYRPVHLMTYYRAMGYKEGDFPVAEWISRHILTIPLFPDMTDEEIGLVIKSVKEVMS